MAKDETASKRLAEARNRYTINLQRAFGDLLLKLKRAYEQPADDAADGRGGAPLDLRPLFEQFNNEAVLTRRRCSDAGRGAKPQAARSAVGHAGPTV